MKNQPSILIHADGTIQVMVTRSARIRLGNKTFRLADQSHNDTLLGPFVYTEIETPQNTLTAEVIPLRPRSPSAAAEIIKEVHVN